MYNELNKMKKEICDLEKKVFSLRNDLVIATEQLISLRIRFMNLFNVAISSGVVEIQKNNKKKGIKK